MYLAQIALECRRSWVRHPARVKLEHMILKFSLPGNQPKLSEQSKGERLKNSKAAWLGAVGLKEENRG